MTKYEMAVLDRLERILELLEKQAAPRRVTVNVEAPKFPPMPKIVRGPFSTDIL